MTTYKLLLCFITKEWYFWGNITIFYLFIFNIMMASFWTWQMTIFGCFWLFRLASPPYSFDRLGECSGYALEISCTGKICISYSQLSSLYFYVDLLKQRQVHMYWHVSVVFFYSFQRRGDAHKRCNINWRDVQRKNVVNIVDMSSLRALWQVTFVSMVSMKAI